MPRFKGWCGGIHPDYNARLEWCWEQQYPGWRLCRFRFRIGLPILRIRELLDLCKKCILFAGLNSVDKRPKTPLLGLISFSAPDEEDYSSSGTDEKLRHWLEHRL
jgi:hypothetical protein